MMNLLCRLACLILLLSPLTASAGELDDHYLARFEALYGTRTAKAASGAVQEGSLPPAERCLTPLYHGVKRDWKELAPETRTVLAKYLGKPTLAGERTYLSSGGHFTIHFAASGADAPPPADADGNGVPDWVETVAAIFEQVYTAEVTQLGYRPGATQAGAPYQVYLQEISGTMQFGHTESELPVGGSATVFSSFIVVDNDYKEAIYAPYLAEKGLQVTAAHEYHHAIQYSYNFYFDIWYAEATATWLEDEVFDEVNQLYTYLPVYFSNSTTPLDTPVNGSAGGGYSRWIFNRYLAERYGVISLRKYWERLATLPATADGKDIPALPVLHETVKSDLSGDLGSDFFGFAKRVYLRDWATHQGDIAMIPSFVPVQTFDSYPVTEIPVTLPHYSYAYYRFLPTGGAPADLVIPVAKSSAVSVVAFKRERSGTISEYGLDAASSTVTIPAFNSPLTEEVVLLVCNTTLGSSTQVSPAPASNGGGGGGCFIATAAFGSYMHPKVMVLRDFRDRYLLTNRPGRAFVAAYYRLSPPAADFIARHETAQEISRVLLAPVVVVVEYLKWVVLLLTAAGVVGWRSLKRRT